MAKDNRINFRAGDNVSAILSEYHASETISSVINTQLSVFDHVMCASIPEFSSSEWCAIFDALNGTWLTSVGEYVNCESLGYRLRDFDQYSESLSEKWSIDFSRLCYAISELSPAETCTVYFVAEKFWKTDLLKVREWSEIAGRVESLRTRFKPEQLDA